MNDWKNFWFLLSFKNDTLKNQKSVWQSLHALHALALLLDTSNSSYFMRKKDICVTDLHSHTCHWNRFYRDRFTNLLTYLCFVIFIKMGCQVPNIDWLQTFPLFKVKEKSANNCLRKSLQNLFHHTKEENKCPESFERFSLKLT